MALPLHFDLVYLRKPWLTYLLLTLVAAVSFIAASTLPLTDVFRGITTTPGVAALFSILYQAYRDQRKHDHAMELQSHEQNFTLSTASHMASVTFDKHVAFCEAYLKTLGDGLAELFASGPAPSALALADSLLRVRAEYIAWLSPEIEASLEPLERALRKIGAGAHLMKSSPPGQGRAALVEEIYDSLGIMHGMVDAKTEEQQKIAASTVLERLRELLGIRELTTLRRHVLRTAMRRVTDR
jgi:hypothetical protein